MRWRGASGDEMTTPAVLSVGAHVVLLAVALFGFPIFSSPPDDSVADVPIYDASEIGPQSKAPKVSPERPQDRKLPEAEKNTPAPPAPQTEAAPPPRPDPKPEPKPEPQVAATQPKPEPKPAPKPEPHAEKPKEPDAEALKPKPKDTVVEKKPEVKPQPPRQEAKKPAPPKPEPPKPPAHKPEPPKPHTKTFDEILAEQKPMPNRMQRPPQPVAGEGKPNVPGTRTPQTAFVAGRLTQSENAAMADKVRPCWSVNDGGRDASQLIVYIVVDMAVDGRVTDAQIADETRAAMGGNPMLQAFAEAGRRAVLNPRCQPLPYPQHKYAQLKRFVFKFDPRHMR
jgi:hypothetical protein